MTSQAVPERRPQHSQFTTHYAKMPKAGSLRPQPWKNRTFGITKAVFYFGLGLVSGFQHISRFYHRLCGCCGLRSSIFACVPFGDNAVCNYFRQSVAGVFTSPLRLLLRLATLCRPHPTPRVPIAAAFALLGHRCAAFFRPAGDRGVPPLETFVAGVAGVAGVASVYVRRAA